MELRVSKKEELDKADKEIKQADIRLKTVKINLDAIEKDLEELLNLETRLQDNIKFLKKKNIVAMANEYKKAKEDLVRTKARLIIVRKERNDVTKAYHNMELLIYNAKTAYISSVKGNENNVFHGKFGKKNE